MGICMSDSSGGSVSVRPLPSSASYISSSQSSRHNSFHSRNRAHIAVASTASLTMMQTGNNYTGHVRDVAQQQQQQFRTVSLEELKQHNTPSSGWIAVHGKVFDVTQFARNHPGGEGIILSCLGRDATQMFEQKHDFDPMMKLGRYYVGEFAKSNSSSRRKIDTSKR